MATGAFLGVGRPLAVNLGVSTSFLLWRRFYRGMMRKEYMEYFWRSGSCCESEIFAAGFYIEWIMAGKVW